MLGGIHRFHGQTSLRAVYQRGSTARASLVSLRFTYRSTGPYRVAVVVSRKVSKSAVVRNRIRRRIYEIVRRPATPIAPGTDLVFTVFSDQIAELADAKLRATINQLLQKAAGPTVTRS